MEDMIRSPINVRSSEDLHLMTLDLLVIKHHLLLSSYDMS
jgi:hypothetical protein